MSLSKSKVIALFIYLLFIYGLTLVIVFRRFGVQCCLQIRL